MTYFRASDGDLVNTTHEIGRGGEGVIYNVEDRPELVAKIYHPDRRTEDRATKLKAMVATPPDAQTFSTGTHVSIAWPRQVLYSKNRFMGFTMPRISSSPDLYKVINPRLRNRYFVGFDARHLHRVAGNFTKAIAALHEAGHVMGDVNQTNALVTLKTLVTLVDCDSFQIQGEAGEIYRCNVGVPEYTPPELQNILLETVDRNVHTDAFGIAVVIFQLLMEGYHPFSGVPVDPTFSTPDKIDLHCIREGIFPYISNGQFVAPPNSPNYDDLHPELKRLFVQCFVTGQHTPEKRPTAIEWVAALKTAEDDLVQCETDPKHWHPSHMTDCPWCAQVVFRREAAKARAAREAKRREPKPEMYQGQVVGTSGVVGVPTVAASDVWPESGYVWLSLLLNIASLWASSVVPFALNLGAIGFSVAVLRNANAVDTDRWWSYLNIAWGALILAVLGIWLAGRLGVF